MSAPPAQPPPALPVAPMLITAKNAALITGMSWGEVRRWAREHGLTVLKLSYRVHAVDAAAFLASVRASAAARPAPVARDELDQLLIHVGIKR